MPGRARGRMFDIRPERDDEDPATGTGSFPGYPGYGEADDAYDLDEGPADGPVPGRPGRPQAGRNGSGRNGARTGAARGTEAATTAVRAVRGGTGGTGGTGVPGPPGRFPAGAPGGRVAPDGRWDDEEPPLLSHRSDEPAYARDHTPQGFDGGDPDDPAWGRGGYQDDDYYDDGDDPAVADGYPDDGYDDEPDEDEYDEDEYGVGDAPLSVPPPGSGGRPLGPADVEELDPSMTDALARVDLGSVQVPVPYGAEMKLEPSGGERPQAVHLLLPEGRIAVSALAAPRSSGLWSDLAAEIEASLRKGGARVRNARGDWGRELHARTENAASVFVGADGPRWMVYGVATASLETVDALDVELRRVLRGIIVVRGKSPYPPRTVLPLELPERLREEQPDAAPPKASITVSVPAPTPAADDAATRAAPAPATTGATPRDTGAVPREPVGPPRRDGVRPAPAGPPSGPVRRPTEPPTRALPQVQRPAAGSAEPDETAAERTAVAGPPLRPRPGEPVAPAVPAAADDDRAHRDPDRAVRPGRNRPGRPDRGRRAGVDGAGRPDRGALARRHPAPAAAPPEERPREDHGFDGRGFDDRGFDERGFDERGFDERRPAAPPEERPPGVPSGAGGSAAGRRGPTARPAPTRPGAATTGEFRAEPDTPAYGAGHPGQEPAAPPVRRDPAVAALSAADLLAGTAADPAVPDRSTGRTDRPARPGPDAATAEPGRAAVSGTGPSGSDTVGRTGRRRSADPLAGDRPDRDRPDRDRPDRDRPDRDRPDRDRPDRGDDLGIGREPTAGLEPGHRPRPGDLDASAASGPYRGRGGAPGPGGPMAIEDIPLADVPLLEATLDRGPEPQPQAADPLPRRRRRGPDAGRGGEPAPAPTTDDQGWLSAEIAATRRSGRHGAGTGTGWSVADILASATGDTPRDPAAPRDEDVDPADDGPGGDDLFRSPAEAGERYRSTPGRRASHGAAAQEHGGAAQEHGAAAQEHGAGVQGHRAPEQRVDDRRNGHRAPGLPDVGPAADDPADRGAGEPGRTNGHRTNGHPVTGLADYRRTRRGEAGRDATGAAEDPLDGPAHELDSGPDPWTGRAAGGSGLTGRWPSGRGGAGTDPGDLGRHRRD